MKRIVKVMVAGALALSAWASAAQAKEIKVGIVNLSLCCAYFVGMDAAIKDEAKVFPARSESLLPLLTAITRL